jgi:hypothetical protein
VSDELDCQGVVSSTTGKSGSRLTEYGPGQELRLSSVPRTYVGQCDDLRLSGAPKPARKLGDLGAAGSGGPTVFFFPARLLGGGSESWVCLLGVALLPADKILGLWSSASLPRLRVVCWTAGASSACLLCSACSAHRGRVCVTKGRGGFLQGGAGRC